jgi:hypothetical protein
MTLLLNQAYSQFAIPKELQLFDNNPNQLCNKENTNLGPGFFGLQLLLTTKTYIADISYKN